MTVPTAASTLEQTIGAVTAVFADQIAVSAADATAIFNVIYGLSDGKDYGRYFAAENPLVAYSSSSSSVSDLITQGAALRGAVASAADQAKTDAAGGLIVYPSDIIALTEALRASCANPADAIRLLANLALFTVTTPFDGPNPVANQAASQALTVYFTAGNGHAGQPIAAWPNWFGDPFVLQFAQLTAIAATLMRRAAAISLARASADYVPSSYQDAVSIRDTVSDALDNVILEAGDLFDDTSYEALLALQTAVITDLNTRGGNLAQIVNRTFGAQQPALVLAYRLYQDATRADDIIARNNPVHPAFLPVQIEALSS